MENRYERQRALIEILSGAEFSSQGAVLQALSARGYRVTQSSISRDFKECGVVKVGGVYRTSATMELGESAGSVRSLLREVSLAGENMLIVKTDPGLASPVALAIDRGKVSGVLGTIAGDDTIFIAISSEKVKGEIFKKMSNLYWRV